MPTLKRPFSGQTHLPSLGLVITAAACFAAIPAASSVALAAHNIFARGQFAAELGPAVTFSIARASLSLVWATNFVTFTLVSFTVAALFGKPWSATRLLLAALVSGCLVLVPILLLQPLRVWSWLSLGPLGCRHGTRADRDSTSEATLADRAHAHLKPE
jgi:hypothetical protein